MTRLARFFKPSSVAVIGGGWAKNVVKQLGKSQFSGEIWPVHPKYDEVLGHRCFASVDDLPGAPDAAFIGVNHKQTIALVRSLSKIGAGGAICFASGFREAQSQESTRQDLQSDLLAAADDMPILGPNCYGFLNYQSGATLWPDEHGGVQVERGVAIIAQSSNIAINMTMQQRGLPIAQLFTLGNQAQLGVSNLIQELIETKGITAIGLYLEGIDNLANFSEAALVAAHAGIPIVALKVGKTEKSRQASLTHTASLTGRSAASTALFDRLGISEVNDIEVFLETLKLVHFHGALPGNKVISVSCSGGEASLMADMADSQVIEFSDLGSEQTKQLQKVLGDKVTLANPLDYHTYIWGDVATMTECFTAAMSGPHDLSVFVLDTPRADRCDPSGHDCAIESIVAAASISDKPVAVIASISEGLSDEDISRFLAANVVPLMGMRTGLDAIKASITLHRRQQLVAEVAVAANSSKEFIVLNEHQSKQALKNYGVAVPASMICQSKAPIRDAAEKLGFPLVLKALGVSHKTEARAVIVGIDSQQSLLNAIEDIPSAEQYLLEQMINDYVTELLVGVSVDETGVVLLSLGAGGIYTEVLDDVQHLVLPVNQEQIKRALSQLRLAPILSGYRLQSAADQQSMLSAIEGIANYALQNLDRLIELDVNPLIVGEQSAIAVDALIKLRNLE